MLLDGTIISQLNILVLTVALGMMVGAIYDLFRAIRVMARIKNKALFAFDFFFWLLATVLVFSGLVAGTWGEVRVYVFAGLGLGGAIYFFFLSKLFYAACRRFFAAAVRVVSFIVRPLASLAAGLARFTGHSGKVLVSGGRRVIKKIRGVGNKKRRN